MIWCTELVSDWKFDIDWLSVVVTSALCDTIASLFDHVCCTERALYGGFVGFSCIYLEELMLVYSMACIDQLCAKQDIWGQWVFV